MAATTGRRSAKRVAAPPASYRSRHTSSVRASTRCSNSSNTGTCRRLGRSTTSCRPSSTSCSSPATRSRPRQRSSSSAGRWDRRGFHSSPPHRTNANGSARSWRKRTFSDADALVTSGPDGARQESSARPDPRLVFLGGVGEIGRNMALLELDGRVLVIDCGLSFPRAELPGIDLVLPDFEYLRQHAGQLEAIVLTHGHEDHIGAVPYLLREFSAPVYGTALTL